MLFLLPMPARVVLFLRRIDVLCVDRASRATGPTCWLRTVLRLATLIFARHNGIIARISVALHFVAHDSSLIAITLAARMP